MIKIRPYLCLFQKVSNSGTIWKKMEEIAEFQTVNVLNALVGFFCGGSVLGSPR